jgi:hypothetical protein
MTTKHFPRRTLAVGILTIAIAGCGDSTTNPPITSPATGGVPATGGAVVSATGGIVATGGTTPISTGGAPATGGKPETGGTVPATGGKTATGGTVGTGGGTPLTTGGGTPLTTGGARTGGSVDGGAADVAGTGGNRPDTGVGTGGTVNTGTCTASKATGTNVTGSGSHKVVVETNTDPGIKEGTIFRPSDLGPDKKYPIFVWGEGACARQGLANSAAMAEIASYGYFVVADGTPSGGGTNIAMSNDVVGMGKIMVSYISWAIAENEKPCSAYYQSLDTTKVAANGFSCGGLMAAGTAADPRITTWGVTSSGLTSANAAFYKTVHTPVLVIVGGPSDMAYPNGKRDYENISALGFPIMFFSKDIGHGGDLGRPNGGDFTKINLSWLNWQLKGDTGATGKGVLVGAGCKYCTDSAWEVMSKNLP